MTVQGAHPSPWRIPPQIRIPRGHGSGIPEPWLSCSWPRPWRGISRQAPFLQFPAFYIAPAAFTAWYLALPRAIALTIMLPVVRLGFVLWWEEPWEIGYSVMNALIQMMVLPLLALLMHAIAQRTRSLEREVRVLRGILPICSFCK